MSTENDGDEERIDQLEAVVREQQRELEALAETLGIENPKEEAKKYSRRAALGLGAAGVAGAAGYATGSAQAQSQPAGTIGNGDEAVDVQSVNTADSITVTDGEATDTLHYGSNQDRANAGNQSVAVGIGARVPTDGSVSVGYAAARENTGDRVTASGYEAALNNTAFGLTASGYTAARDNTGDRVTASGYRAALNNTGNRVTASGYRAARDNTAFALTASGHTAARDNTGNRVTASGYAAALNNTGNRVTASGYRAARDNTGDRVTASGYEAARDNTGTRVTASGYAAARGDGLADPTTMGDDNIGIGENAIRNNQASGIIAIGQDAGINAQTDDQLIITQRDGTRRMQMDLTTGDLSITGTLTENATL
jgi:hypothetical protein